MPHHLSGRTLLHRTLLGLLVLISGVLALQATTAMAAVQTQVYTGQDDGPTPDIYRSDIADYFTPGGAVAPLIGQAGTINLTLDGTPVVAYCIDVTSGLNTATVQSDVQEAPLDTIDRRAQLYVLLNQTPTGAPTPVTRNQAAVAQIATWILEGDLREVDPTSDPAVNADVAELLAIARAQAALPASLALSVASPAAGATSTTVTVTGRPGAVVALTITAGEATLSAGQVTIGAGGTATATLTAATPGAVSVGASTAGDGTLYRVIPIRGSQATTFARPSVLVASGSVSFQAAPTTPTTPTTPVTPATPAGSVTGRISLNITKTGPSTARVLAQVPYRITVRNSTKRVANGVVVRDVIPRGLAFVRASRAASVRNGAVVISLGRLAPGATRTFTVWLRAPVGVRGARTNVATVSGVNVRTLSARAGTTFAPLVRRIQPAVTG